MEYIFYCCCLSWSVSDEDFTADPNLSIVFEEGITTSSATRCTSIDIEDDTLLECDHSFTVLAGTIACDVNPAIIPSSTSATVVIEDDEGNNAHLMIICVT